MQRAGFRRARDEFLHRLDTAAPVLKRSAACLAISPAISGLQPLVLGQLRHRMGHVHRARR
jgi:hypothetical protein